MKHPPKQLVQQLSDLKNNHNIPPPEDWSAGSIYRAVYPEGIYKGVLVVKIGSQKPKYVLWSLNPLTMGVRVYIGLERARKMFYNSKWIFYTF